MITCVYGVLATGCTGLGWLAMAAVDTPATPATELSTEARWTIVVSALLYVLALVPGAFALLARPAARPLHLVWAVAVLAVETLAMGIYYRDNPESYALALACNVPVFMSWPLLVLVLFRRPVPSAARGSAAARQSVDDARR